MALLLIACNPNPGPLNAVYQTVQTTQNMAVPITIKAAGADASQILTYQLGTPANGSLTGTAPDLIYTPNLDFIGIDEFTFSVSNGTITSNTATVTVEVSPLAITALDQTVQTNQNMSVLISLDISGGLQQQNLTYQVQPPTNGTFSGTAPNLNYTPPLDFTGIDSFSFFVTNGIVTSNIATITIDVVPTPLTAANQTLQTAHNTPVAITLGVTGGSLQQTLTYQVGIPTNGTMVGTAPDVTYTPAPGFSGTDQFTFSASNGLVTSNTATISIDVAPLPITTADQTVQTSQNTPVGITLSATGGVQQNITYLVGLPATGSVTDTAPNLTYTPSLDFIGTDQFTFSASDGIVTSNTSIVTIDIAPLPLTVANQTVQTEQDVPIGITLSSTGGLQQNVTYQVGIPTNGTITGIAPNLTYTPTLGFIGTDQFTFSATDGVDTSTIATVTVDVTAPLFPITLQGTVLPEEASISFNVSKPVGAVTAVATLTVYDADFADEGELVVNGNLPIPLFGADGITANNNLSTNVVLNIPATQWNDGPNSLTFRHTSTQGYIIEGLTVTFQ